MLIWRARCSVQPRKKSERRAAGGLGWEANQRRMGSWRWARALMMGRLPDLPRSLTFSTPEGRAGWGGKGRTRGWTEEGWAERRGERVGRFWGVVKMVMGKRRRAS
ncbi:hypothetical protein TIFTF001_051443 [Ficus carica]|uniref:Uncharacterized protein n=1 Tax=Ficus carica TaxID=3494 RepID=A0AA88CP42_FICCA|nr:hypothetical protein TIFTF001_051443 [Ficus carica]